jgi:hypothetical protein
MFVGFVAAAYSVVANDAIQTLGTFLSSNRARPWWVLWMYAGSILLAVLVYGWVVNGGDVAYGRLSKFPEPPNGITWIHAVPPIFILLLTRYGVPVSTTFLVLTVFAPTNTVAILIKSGLGYVLATGTGLVVYAIVSKYIEQRILNAQDKESPQPFWVVGQWLSTGFLWSQWLVQDLANVFVYLPRHLGPGLFLLAILLMLIMHAFIFAHNGGEIQKIVSSKTNTADIRSATLVDFIYGLILLYFKEMSNLPMSTTWVFLGLLGGREIAISWRVKHRALTEAFSLAAKDVGKASIGLAVSLGLAVTLPRLDRVLRPNATAAASSAEHSTQGTQPSTQTVRASIH